MIHKAQGAPNQECMDLTRFQELVFEKKTLHKSSCERTMPVETGFNYTNSALLILLWCFPAVPRQSSQTVPLLCVVVQPLKPSPSFASAGSPSKAVSTMSLSVRPSRRVISRSITRSQSFAGVNSHDKPYR